jgi:hypothetical protein
LNLDRRTDRWATMGEQGNRLGLELLRVPAFPEDIGWIGCGRSHQSVVRKGRDQGLPYVVVAEDDCVFSEDVHARLERILGWLEAHDGEWDVFLGGGLVREPPLLLLDEHLPLMRVRNTYCAQLVVYAATAYDRLLSPSFLDLDVPRFVRTARYRGSCDGIEFRPIDEYFDHHGLRTLMTSPTLAIQDGLSSDIDGGSTNYLRESAVSEVLLQSFLAKHRSASERPLPAAP